MGDIKKYNKNIFETIKQLNEYGYEFWSARDLAKVLEYSKWSNFVNVINKAKISCKQSGINNSDHFADVGKTINLPKGATREIPDIMLSRYACYLIVQNADPNKDIIALGQTYFAFQTRRQELQEEYEQLTEEKKRLAIRNELKKHNIQLADAAKNAGVIEPIDYAIFQNHGYMGLYGGLKAKDIHTRKRLKRSQKILDFMGSTELAANLFRATQTEENFDEKKLREKKKHIRRITKLEQK